jgi:hypothetical protein
MPDFILILSKDIPFAARRNVSEAIKLFSRLKNLAINEIAKILNQHLNPERVTLVPIPHQNIDRLVRVLEKFKILNTTLTIVIV